MLRTEIDINSNDNSLFVTAQCNNRCLMCSQPPLKRDDIELHYHRNLSIIQSAPQDLKEIGITGGEPTLLGEKLFDLLLEIQNFLSDTHIHILTNGRAFADINYARNLAEKKIQKLLLGIPLHSDFCHDHDLISQVTNSYAETFRGLYNLARYDIDIELRIVVNKINYKRLPQIARFIYKNLPFVRYTSFMGMEDTGYSIKNHNQVWIDPVDYQEELERAVLDLATWGMNVSVFNLPYCLIKPSLYEFACKSISDWKVYYEECCQKCHLKSDCCGLFSTSKRQSDHIYPVLETS